MLHIVSCMELLPSLDHIGRSGTISPPSGSLTTRLILTRVDQAVDEHDDPQEFRARTSVFMLLQNTRHTRLQRLCKGKGNSALPAFAEHYRCPVFSLQHLRPALYIFTAALNNNPCTRCVVRIPTHPPSPALEVNVSPRLINPFSSFTRVRRQISGSAGSGSCRWTWIHYLSNAGGNSGSSGCIPLSFSVLAITSCRRQDR